MSATAHVYRAMTPKIRARMLAAFRSFGDLNENMKAVFEEYLTDIRFNWRQYREIPNDFRVIWDNACSDVKKMIEEEEIPISDNTFIGITKHVKKSITFNCSMKLAKKPDNMLRKARSYAAKKLGDYNPTTMDTAYSVLSQVERDMKATEEQARQAALDKINAEKSIGIADISESEPEGEIVEDGAESDSGEQNTAAFTYNPENKGKRADLKIYSSAFSLGTINGSTNLQDAYQQWKDTNAAWFYQKGMAMMEYLEGSTSEHQEEAKKIRDLFLGK